MLNRMQVSGSTPDSDEVLVSSGRETGISEWENVEVSGPLSETLPSGVGDVMWNDMSDTSQLKKPVNREKRVGVVCVSDVDKVDSEAAAADCTVVRGDVCP